ncbi:hypothetical protein SAY87_003292 [Trapa incisa]|uniref:Protein kinase domain-containing protein n=1 Tax=Trapa incisa TaxID=236973 RepID=A0AAN7QHH6_9MYRT|nr:hypothetical protein SAY87_003292 [Trapa incisa]
MSASCFQTLSLHYLHLLFFFSSFYFISRAVESYASKDDPLYTECNIPFTCGPQWPPRRNVTYPFWGNRRARHCGVDGFELGCQDDEYPFMEFNSQKYRVLDIDQVSRVMTLARSDLWKGPCIASPLLNTAMDNNTLFDYPKGVKNISIFYCPYHDPDDSPLKFPDGIDCNVSDKIAILIADDAVDRTISEYADLDQCDRIKVPVLERLINETAPEQEKWEEVLRGGFNLTYRLDGKRKNIPLKVGIGVGSGGGVFFLLIMLFLCYRCRNNGKMTQSYTISRSFSSSYTSRTDLEKSDLYYGLPVFDYNELQEATNNFDPQKELGEGGFGTVFFGKLRDGRSVAVKRLYENNYKRVELFMNEVEILARLRHPNLVILYGCTSRLSHRLLLVYEYVPNGTVADHLHGNLAKPGSLQWSTRLNIAIETASALVYLHATDIIHRDVKTNNILLDENFSVKVADFGLSRLFPFNVTHVSTAPQGTPGYVDPEYHQCYQLTEKSDVYSFGVVLMELISSLPAVDITRHRHEINLSTMAINKIHSQALHELVDPHLGFDSNCDTRKMITAVSELGFQCLQSNKEMRPSMTEVLTTLKDIRKLGMDENKKAGEKEHTALLKTVPPSPDSVMTKFVSASTTPNASG